MPWSIVSRSVLSSRTFASIRSFFHCTNHIVKKTLFGAHPTYHNFCTSTVEPLDFESTLKVRRFPIQWSLCVREMVFSAMTGSKKELTFFFLFLNSRPRQKRVRHNNQNLPFSFLGPS